MTSSTLFTGLFAAVWLAGVVTWFVGAGAMLRWMQLRREPEGAAYLRKAFKAGAVFAGFVLLLFAIGGVASWIGAWP